MSMTNTNITLTPATKKALLWCVENSIDMLNDMALDPMWMNPSLVRELAQKSDGEIQATFAKNGKEADQNIENLVQLQILRLELLNE